MKPMQFAEAMARMERRIESLKAEVARAHREIENIRADHDINTGHLSPRAVRRLAERDVFPAA